MNNIVLANLVKLFHTIIILFVLLTPFLLNKYHSLLILHISFSLCLIIHWVNNSNVCSLTLLESRLRGIEPDESFLYQFISPIYDIPTDIVGDIVYYSTFISSQDVGINEKRGKNINC